MLSSLFRSKTTRRQQASQRSPFSSPFSDRTVLSRRRNRATNGRRRVAADFDDEDDDRDENFDEEDDADEDDADEDDEEEEDIEEDDDDHNDEGIMPLLPLFEASHLGTALHIVHYIPSLPTTNS